MNISLIIRDLLLRNEQLVIPGFGTFKIIHRPAQISRTTQVLLPPAREIVFDSQIKSGDNQLLLFIKKKHSLSEAESGETVKKYIHSLEENIRSVGFVVLEGLGKITRQDSGNLIFEPIPDLLNPGGVFALPNIDIPVTAKKERPEQSPIIKNHCPCRKCGEGENGGYRPSGLLFWSCWFPLDILPG